MHSFYKPIPVSRGTFKICVRSTYVCKVPVVEDLFLMQNCVSVTTQKTPRHKTICGSHRVLSYVGYESTAESTAEKGAVIA